MLEEDDEDIEENSCIPRGTLQISAPWISLSPSVWKGIRERIPQKLWKKLNLLPHYIVSKKNPTDYQFAIRGTSGKGTTGCRLSASNTADEPEGVTAKVE